MAKALSSQEFMVEALYMYHGGGQTSIAEGQSLPKLSDEQRKLTDPMQVIQALQENARSAAVQHLLDGTKPKFTEVLQGADTQGDKRAMEITYGRIRDVLIEAGFEDTIGRAPVMDKNGKPSREMNFALIKYQKEHGMLPTGFLPDGGLDPATQYLLSADRLAQMEKKGYAVNMGATTAEDKAAFLAEKGILDPTSCALAARVVEPPANQAPPSPPPAPVDPRQAKPGELSDGTGQAVVDSNGNPVLAGSADETPPHLRRTWELTTEPRPADVVAIPAAPKAAPFMGPPEPTAGERMAADAAELAGRAKTAGGQLAADAAEMAGRAKTAGGQLAADAQAGLAEAGQQAGRLANQAGAALSEAAEQGRQAVVEGLDKLKGWLAPDKPTAPAAPAAKAAGTPKPRPPANSSAQFD